ncbi:uncharacterized protein LOC131015756 [Salvia miltiorrhiza]|uniref:uncharacterized protein LOC131015756 n=1 Tax=Salvia miltiorrhiza TaxID=226208 RepID=UPI0025AC03A4|nr:uncharacterized protein LOC131015756 [Salvia miltiorrhiza]
MVVTVLLSSEQAVILHCLWKNDSFKMAIIHGANNYLDRRQLWLDLLNHISGPSVFMGDFNAVKGAHERSSDCLPCAISCRDFRDFIEATSFIEPSSVGLKFTWSGRRFMPSHVESTIDRALFSEAFADRWDAVYTQALPRNTSDHSPLVLHCDKNVRSNSRFFKFLHMWTLHDGFQHMVAQSWQQQAESNKELLEVQQLIADYGYSEDLFDKEVTAQARINSTLSRKHSLLQQKSRLFHENSQDEVDITTIEASIDPMIDDSHNALLTKIPDEEEITAAIFSMDASSSPGPDGFTGKFFQSCWALIRNDVCKAVRTFFEKTYLPHGCNSSIMVLLPKKDMVDSVGDLRPIVLSNFFYKIIPKILASRLSVVAATFVSGNQFGFISGRNIHDCIMLGFEGVNCMRRIGGGRNMACKIDISKTFDTLRWDFLFKVLKVSGYDEKFICWIGVLLHSARLSILYNGQSHGYFPCSRGVRQGDPLSPILFAIAEEVLGALFSNCVASRHLVPMTMKRGSIFPTHLLYADDILVFCKASTGNATTIQNILSFYGSLSGQSYNAAKSYVYFSDKVPNHLRRAVGRIMDFKKGALPFTYLGVPLFVGRVHANVLRPIHDKIVNKFSRWKGMKLSMAGRVCLVKSVIQSSLTHSMMIYRWPRSLLKDLDAKCRNFIWTGDASKRPSHTVAWARVCAIKEEGGLGIRSFSMMNKCFLMKRAWNIIKGRGFGYDLMRDRYLKTFGQVKGVAAPSSIWLGVRSEIPQLVSDSYCYIGTGELTSFWNDDWLGFRIADKCGVPHFVRDFLNQYVAEYFYDGIWHFTQNFIDAYPDIVCAILVLPVGEDRDTRFWKPSLHGEVTSALAFAHHCHRFPKVKWGAWIWERHIPVRRSLVCWRILHGRMPTLDRLIQHSLITPNRCVLCMADAETMDHIFWKCPQVKTIWAEFLSWFNLGSFLEVEDIHSFLVVAWNRNGCVFEDTKFVGKQVIHFIKVAFLDIEQNFKKIGCMPNTCHDLKVLRNLGVRPRSAPPPSFINVYWWPPPNQWIKVNTDGSALGAPGKIAAEGVFRDKFSWVRGCFHIKGGIGFAFEAELLAVISAIQIAFHRNWKYLWIESDSTYIVNLLQARSLDVPWRFAARWKGVLAILTNFNLHVTHIFREGNKVADILAANNMQEGWWPMEIEPIKQAVRVDMNCHSHLRMVR